MSKKMGKRPVIIPAILRKLQEGVYTTAELIDVFCSGYGESYRKARQYAYGTRSLDKGKDWGDAYIQAQQFYNLLNYLKRQGLVGNEKKKGGRHARWRITARGLKRLKSGRYEPRSPEKDRVFRVVIFDVPEEAKVQREWLRETLRALGFSLLQDSVWVGAWKIPEWFLFDLRERDLIPFVHIFEVEKEGSIVVRA